MRRPKEQIFSDVISTLQELVRMTSLDADAFWLRDLQTFLEDALELRTKGNPSEDEIRDLCGSIRSIFDGRDNSFGLYEPLVVDPTTNKYSPIPGTETFPKVRDRLSELAEEIRTVGKY